MLIHLLGLAGLLAPTYPKAVLEVWLLFLILGVGKYSLKLSSEEMLFYPLSPKPEINKSQPFAQFPFRIRHFPT